MIFIVILVLLILVALFFIRYHSSTNGGFDENFWLLERINKIDKSSECKDKIPPGPNYKELLDQIKNKLGISSGVIMHIATTDDYLKEQGKGQVKTMPEYDTKKTQAISKEQFVDKSNYIINNSSISKNDLDHWMNNQATYWQPGKMNWRDPVNPLQSKPWGENVMWSDDVSIADRIRYEKIIFAWTRFQENMYRHINESYWKYQPININGIDYRYTIQMYTEKKTATTLFEQIKGGNVSCLKVIIVNDLITDLTNALQKLRNIKVNNKNIYQYTGVSERYVPDTYYSELPLIQRAIDNGVYADDVEKSIIITSDKYNNMHHTFNQFIATAHRQPIDDFELKAGPAKVAAFDRYDHNRQMLQNIGSHYENYKIPDRKSVV